MFSAITLLPEYYPTRCEAEILAAHDQDIAALAQPVRTLIDLGAGDCVKAERLLPALRPACYMPVDISVDYLGQAVQRLKRGHPDLDIVPIEQDFSAGLTLPPRLAQDGRLVFFPGSSIGNLDPARALALLRNLASLDAQILIGVDRVKARDILEPAYDDALHLTAAFNLNLLRHVNHVLGSDFDARDWEHHARYNEAEQRVEMHLRALRDVRVAWPGERRHFTPGETIHTENSYKYTIDGFEGLLREAGYRNIRHWSDTRDWFTVFHARR
ncbi:dimethylhistidine N-methyltransferase [Bordetella pseudohinzii]|uniref:Dimethylhistidine N-methyltransferase n=1 Tax=Bordetella pseudohinzii TaxID=1331258 RepID=A0ABN4RXZ9_9BORD|nr:dimethylhistidine N-methyltransferase [Bordetella pseudohinzii]KXA78784.1 dimethylhistidine N-methyltransferase [Bordetella pseudohinzii]KXA81459.1 dimethylhistidine N-methyltransferase [Bordetella pseudohinzii]